MIHAALWLLLPALQQQRTGGWLQTPAQKAAFEEACSKFSYPIVLKDEGELGGPGLDKIMEYAKGTRFVMIGENHGCSEIPGFTSALFKELQKTFGYQFLCVEDDPVPLQELAGKAYRGNLINIFDFVEKYPNAIAFSYDEELKMLAEVGRLSKANYDPVWGTDQAFGVLFQLEKLAKDATKEQAIALEPYLKEARKRDSKNFTVGEHYMYMTPPDYFVNLKKAFNPAPEGSAERLIDGLIKSKEIYEYNRLARTEAVGYLSNFDREEMMKGEFLRHYQEAAKIDSEPKVLLKYGQNHMFRGMTGFTQVPSLGGFVSDFARVLGGSSLNISTEIYGDKDFKIDFNKRPEMEPYEKMMADEQWRILDLREFRKHYYRGEFGRAPMSISREYFGYDLILFITRSHDSVSTWIKK